LVLSQGEAMPGLEVVVAPHLKLAGMRIDPVRRGRPLAERTMSITLRAVASGEEHRVDVPPGHWSTPIWSADDRAFALLHGGAEGTELWLADPATATPRRVPEVMLNGVLGPPAIWLPDQRRLLVRRASSEPPPPPPRVPFGPRVMTTKAGQIAQVRTYQDLLRNAYDEALFEHYARCQLAIVDVATAQVTDLGAPGLIDDARPSPDGSLLWISEVHRPFSYLVPWQSFPRTNSLWSMDGGVIRVLHGLPLCESVPIGGVATGPRQLDWMPVQPHTLTWIEALDGGDPRQQVEHRDRVMMLDDKDAEPVVWFQTRDRASTPAYSGAGDLALVTEIDRKSRRSRLMAFDPRDPARPGREIEERSLLDAYADPGRPVSERTPDGSTVLRSRAGALFLSGSGATPAGNRPFVDRWQVATGDKERLFCCAADRHETFVDFLDADGNRLLIRSESPSEPPSLVVVDAGTGKRETMLVLPDPVAEATRGITRQLLHYQREDGVAMSGTLYLPPGVDADAKLPALIWAYPLEYVKASDAGQVRASPNRYPRLRGASHLFMLLAGYAVFDDAAMPIVGPVRGANDTFVAQLQMNARAAVRALGETGLIDTGRLAIAGHSYGAFMAVNLLAHTDLFAAGIARSGAYNRTLTPFGFQREERTYWEAPEVYAAMSPFMHAPEINEPLLLIHGDDDNNSGTFPIQSERLFAAIKGHGGTARLCMLPGESHGYRARESVLHCLAEMVRWLDTYCGPAPR
ncbi:MAG: S9 family peptidase, partial [Planctomycetes bacterium]|nr:S9 family peptidase [Planctomycetota bacterium]